MQVTSEQNLLMRACGAHVAKETGPETQLGQAGGGKPDGIDGEPRERKNNENAEKVKSNENTCIYNTFERLGHQNSREFPFKNHQKT